MPAGADKQQEASPANSKVLTRRSLRHSLRESIESSLQALWYPRTERGGLCSTLLLPLSYVYARIVKRKLVQRLSPGFDDAMRPDCLVVVVGNITVGGTGKTPFLLKLAETLHTREYSFAVLSRGYGGSHVAHSDQPRWVSVDDDAAVVGDEPLLLATEIARFTDDTRPAVMIGAKRKQAMQKVLAERAALGVRTDVILSDDGLQHYALARDVEFAVVDDARRFGNRRLLPAGPLREPVARLQLCDTIILNGAAASGTLALEGQAALGMQLHLSAFRPLALPAANDPRQHSTESFAQALERADTVIAVAALGNPRRFFDAMRELLQKTAPGKKLACAAFADHHAYCLADFEHLAGEHKGAGEAVFIMTGKDAVKCRQFADSMPLPSGVAEVEVDVHGSAFTAVFSGLQQLSAWREAQNRSLLSTAADDASA
ncbi:MAG: tetraacyldisaccharide 4'-kinase [Gammaproteobacteria bacterium]|nr:tetraacyldisaccharide 4'-kinase [Gammaproteobacteria bacterium]NNL12008.1 tetraacyldisaccharide 4'-kinase [Pseudomonadales bacterium]